MKIQETFELAYQNHKKNNFKTAEQLYKKILKEQSNHFESVFYLGTLSMQTKNFDSAIKWYEKAIKIKPDIPDSYNNLGNIFQNLKYFEKAKDCYEKAIKINPNYLAAYNNLGTVFQRLGEIEKSKECYEKTIKIDPNYSAAYNNIGNIFIELRNYEKAIDNCKQAIKIHPNYSGAYNNLGTAFQKLKKYEKAIQCYEKAIKIDPNYLAAYNNLGKILRALGKPKEAKKYFEKINSSSSRAEHLECVYFSEELTNYKNTLEKLTKEDPLNLRVATLAAYVSQRENIKNTYPFCKDLLKFVYTKNLKDEFESEKILLSDLLKTLGKLSSVWEPNSYTTKGGFQSMGNLFNKKDTQILKLKKIIEKQILNYKDIYKDTQDFFIKKWPDKSTFRGWHVKLLKQGHQRSHIHPAGWLSGVIYLEIPKLLDKNEGSIEFTLYGYDYPNHKNLPNLIYAPKVYDIALFPSSLFHRTIPFNSEDERQSIAFDLVPA